MWPDGRTVIVDAGHGAYQIFGQDGEYERHVRIADRRARGFASSGRAARDGEAVFLTRQPVVNLSHAELEVDLGDRTIYRVPLLEEVAVGTSFAEGWVPRGRDQRSVEVRDPKEAFASMGNAITYFEPRLLFDVLPDGGVVYSDSSGYAIKIQSQPSSPESDPASAADTRNRHRPYTYPCATNGSRSLRGRTRSRWRWGGRAASASSGGGAGSDPVHGGWLEGDCGAGAFHARGSGRARCEDHVVGARYGCSAGRPIP